MVVLKPYLNDTQGDLALINAIKNNENVYLSMNMDYTPEEMRKSPTIEDKFKLKIKEGALEDNAYITFTNARTVMKEISNVTNNIGTINVTRDEDGIIRNATPIFKYKNDYYPNLSLLVGMKELGQNEVSLKNNKIILDEETSIPLDSTQRTILNWYGGRMSYKHIPVWKTISAIKHGDKEFLKNNFQNKIIYVGATALSLSDIKSTPIESNVAGVELHTTFLNNILDNNFIKKTDVKIDIAISLFISLLIGYCILNMPSVAKTFILLAATITFYSVFCTFAMYQFNLWIGLVLPIISSIATFILIYCEKYLMKVKDYEQTYKLAVSDGLTGLFNHRYFQEQMINNINNFKRYNTAFSLILIDIDFFKKFNDTYGHQSGDCVLKQVANILKRNSRTSDIVCRYGGEEMSIILTNTNKPEAVITANKICEAVRNNQFILANGEKVNVTISVGVSTVGINGETPQEIIEFSDKCLYKAKESGRNQVVSEV